MRWFKPNLRGSIHAIFSSGHFSQPAETAPQAADIEEIRESMLALMTDVDDNRCLQLARRIRYAIDVQALWYLRGDLMAVLAGRYGEAAAREKIDALAGMFEDLLPRGLKSRPSPLNLGPKD